MERVFQISAVVLAGVAAYFLWAGNNDGAWVAGVLGAVSFFLSVRTQVTARNAEREAEQHRQLEAAAALESEVKIDRSEYKL
jgi:hypothetical protein